MSYPYYYPTSNYPAYSYPPRLYAHDPTLASNHDSEMMGMGPEYGIHVGTTSGSGIDPSTDPTIPDDNEPRLPKPPHNETELYLRRTLGIPEPHPVNLWSIPDSRQLTHSEQIRLAIWGSPEKRLTLSQIFAAVEARYPRKARLEDKPWQRSIRHNLSLKKIFVQEPRPNDHPGKGNYWVLNVRYGEACRPRKKDATQGDSGSGEDSQSLPSSTTSSPQPEFFAPSYHTESPQLHTVPLNPENTAIFESLRRADGRRSMDRHGSAHPYQLPQAVNPMMTVGNYHDSEMRLGPSLQRVPHHHHHVHHHHQNHHAFQPGPQGGHYSRSTPQAQVPRRHRTDSDRVAEEDSRSRYMPMPRRSTD